MSHYSLLSTLLLLITVSEISSLSFFILLTLNFVFLSVAGLYSSNRHSLTCGLVCLLSLIIGCFLCTYSLLVFFIIYELSLFPVSLLILLLGYQPEKINSMLYLLLYTVICSAPLLYMSVSSNSSLCSGFSSISTYASFLVCTSFLVKSPMYTLHSWLPKAHVEAPLIGSIILAGVILKLGSYGLLLLAPYLSSSSSFFVYITLLGGVVCSVLCFRCWDMKSLVAYSSVVHIGVVTLGALSGHEVGFWVACGIVIGHSLLSPLLFVLAFELYRAFGSRNFVCGHFSPGFSHLLLAIRLCFGLNFGLPPFLNFWVEVSLFSIQGTIFSLSLLPLILTAFLSFVYCIFFYVLACGGPSSSLLQHFPSPYIYIPSLFFSLALAFSSSILLP